MNAFGYDLSPALHIAEAKVIELLSGTSFAQFLMVFPHLRGLSFHQSHRFMRWLGEETFNLKIYRAVPNTVVITTSIRYIDL